ncbi:hypothetical protein [Calidifontibacter indicus]|uniref:hypothetical protein n=1 Tax=Calidifontibacter indicus TaxID=419650 RepID=UPI003D7489CA
MTRAGTGGALTYKGAYDEAGTLVTEELPGGITRVVTTNALKDDTGLTYKGQVTPTTATTTLPQHRRMRLACIARPGRMVSRLMVPAPR